MFLIAFMKLFTPSILPLLMWKVALETMPSILFVTVLVNYGIPTDEYNFDHSSSLVLISVEILRGSALFFCLLIH